MFEEHRKFGTGSGEGALEFANAALQLATTSTSQVMVTIYTRRSRRRHDRNESGHCDFSVVRTSRTIF